MVAHKVVPRTPENLFDPATCKAVVVMALNGAASVVLLAVY